MPSLIGRTGMVEGSVPQKELSKKHRYKLLRR